MVRPFYLSLVAGKPAGLVEDADGPLPVEDADEVGAGSRRELVDSLAVDVDTDRQEVGNVRNEHRGLAWKDHIPDSLDRQVGMLDTLLGGLDVLGDEFGIEWHEVGVLAARCVQLVLVALDAFDL